MSLYLHAQFLEVLYYRTINCTTKIGMLIRDDASLVADAIIYILVVQSRKWVVGRPQPTKVEDHAPEDRLHRGTD